MSIQTRVIQVDRDWLLVCFKGVKPPPERRSFFLHDSVSQWLKDHPGRSMIQSEAIHHGGELVGMHVWLELSGESETETLPEPAEEKPRPKRDGKRSGKFPVSIDNDLVETIHKEHLEALIDHAYNILLKDEGQSPVLAVISRGGLAVVLERASSRSHLMRLEKLGLRGAAADELHRWQTAGETTYFVLPMKSYNFDR